MRKQIDWIISQPREMDLKIRSVAEVIWFEISGKLELQVESLAEDIVLGRVDYPSVVEFRCPMD